MQYHRHQVWPERELRPRVVCMRSEHQHSNGLWWALLANRRLSADGSARVLFAITVRFADQMVIGCHDDYSYTYGWYRNSRLMLVAAIDASGIVSQSFGLPHSTPHFHFGMHCTVLCWILGRFEHVHICTCEVNYIFFQTQFSLWMQLALITLVLT